MLTTVKRRERGKHKTVGLPEEAMKSALKINNSAHQQTEGFPADEQQKKFIYVALTVLSTVAKSKGTIPRSLLAHCLR